MISSMCLACNIIVEMVEMEPAIDRILPQLPQLGTDKLFIATNSPYYVHSLLASLSLSRKSSICSSFSSLLASCS